MPGGTWQKWHLWGLPSRRAPLSPPPSPVLAVRTLPVCSRSSNQSLQTTLGRAAGPRPAAWGGWWLPAGALLGGVICLVTPLLTEQLFLLSQRHSLSCSAPAPGGAPATRPLPGSERGLWGPELLGTPQPPRHPPLQGQGVPEAPQQPGAQRPARFEAGAPQQPPQEPSHGASPLCRPRSGSPRPPAQGPREEGRRMQAPARLVITARPGPLQVELEPRGGQKRPSVGTGVCPGPALSGADVGDWEHQSPLLGSLCAGGG